MASSLAAELYHIIGSFCMTETEIDGGLAAPTVVLLPDLRSLSSFSRTCSTIHDSLNWLFFDACRQYPLLGLRALRYAVQHSQLQLVDRLVAERIPLGGCLELKLERVQTQFPATPLILAASNGDTAMVRKLLKHYGLDQAAIEAYRRPLSRTALDEAAHKGAIEIIHALASIRPHPEDRSSLSYSQYLGNALHAAVGRPSCDGGTETTQALLQKYGADANFICDNTTVLHRAVVLENTALVQLLLEYGADPDVGGDALGQRLGRNTFPLYAAAESGNGAILALLLDAGADIHIRSPLRETVLKAALKGRDASKYLDVCRLLLVRGAQVDACDVWGQTPLHYACRSPSLDRPLLEFLLHWGATSSVNEMNRWGVTPVDAAIQQHGRDSVDIIETLMRWR